MDKVFFFCVNFDRQSRGNSDVNCVDVGGVTIENLVTSGVQAHGFSYSGVRPVIIAGHTPENLGFRTQFQLPVGTSTLGGRPGDFDKSFVEGQVVPENKPEKLVIICVLDLVQT